MAFQKGNKFGKGRPPKGESIAEYVRQKGGEMGEAYVDRLHDLATGAHQNVAARLQAINILLERGFGRPLQEVNIGNKDGKPFGVNHIHE